VTAENNSQSKARVTYIAPKAACAASVALCNTRQGCRSAYSPQLKPALTDFGMQPCSHTALVFRLVVSTRVVHEDYYSLTDLAKPPEGARGRYLKTLDKDCAPQIRVHLLLSTHTHARTVLGQALGLMKASACGGCGTVCR